MNSYCTLPFQIPDDLRNRVLGWDGNQHVHMVQHQMALFDPAFFLLGQFPEEASQLPSQCPIERFPSALGDEYDVIFTLPFGMLEVFKVVQESLLSV